MRKEYENSEVVVMAEYYVSWLLSSVADCTVIYNILIMFVLKKRPFGCHDEKHIREPLSRTIVFLYCRTMRNLHYPLSKYNWTGRIPARFQSLYIYSIFEHNFG